VLFAEFIDESYFKFEFLITGNCFRQCMIFVSKLNSKN